MTDEQITEVRRTLSKAIKKQEHARGVAMAHVNREREQYHYGIMTGLHHALMMLGGPVPQHDYAEGAEC
jgi:hypothetical protein